MIGTTEIVVIVAAGLVLFGASAVPKFARSLGQAKKEFQNGLKEEQKEEEEEKRKIEKNDDKE
ncbi:MAG: twin-arginine translocase TatA/TatE family subunit [Spirochaetaceae bacterium]